MRPIRRAVWRVVVVALPGVLGAQSVRVQGTSSAQSIDLRPLRRDSIPVRDAVGSGGLRLDAAGRPVRCSEGTGYCLLLSQAPRVTARPMVHDISVAAWGLGEGIAFHAGGRARNALGGETRAWPRLADRFDLLNAYLEVDRSRARVRVGRQWAVQGLGAYHFDGGDVLWRQGAARLQLYGGRALVQGLFEPHTTDELGVVDDLPPDDNAWLIGGRAQWRPSSGAAWAAVFQRVLRRDRDGLYADRAGADGAWRALGASWTAAVAYDVASQVFNELRLRATRRLVAPVDVALEVRRQRPYFELWTIWGAFAPIAFDEARATASWNRDEGRLAMQGSVGYRRYADPGTGLDFIPLRSDGWRASWDASWSPSPEWSLVGGYAVDIGFGSSQNDGTAGARWALSERVEVGARASATQTIYEFRVGTGRVLGVGGDVAVGLGGGLRVSADAGVYAHRLTQGAPGVNWSQRRASIRLEWVVGAEPGLREARR